ncbi:AbiJ-NTD4 domain-containing protein [Stutzerimonas stutzeri]|uniref:AbiJ-NTD4 domain-containing protein n=1 Tax=Stutzerimonas stutzeri TaxID=316 RepID=UPI0015E432F7|nr:hypothetical protein [Stutzerimonas stutzeri]MBA1276835.1 hypothetical protein [Stutzerimonas stutzeri]
MPKFSERIGAVEVPKLIQLEGMDDALRNTIWNFLISLFNEGESSWWRAAQYIARFFQKKTVDEIPPTDFYCREEIKSYFYSLPWYEVYDLVEFISENHKNIYQYSNWNKVKIQAVFNKIFEAELSGYRFVSEQLVPISNSAETASIESAIDIAARSGLSGAQTHITAALQLLAKRPNPDYRNSIKESISAVESVAKQLGSHEAQGLSGALDELAKKIPLHGALKAAFTKLYGYTSDESGIRHAMLEDSNVGYDEAKYMAIACSAFVNYLATKSQEHGLFNNRAN